MADLVVGVDPGLTGWLVALDERCGSIVSLAVMPTCYDATARKPRPRVNAVSLARWLDSRKMKVLLVACERVAAGPSMSKHATCSLCSSAAVVEGVCAGLGLPFSWVTPSQWTARLLRSTTSGNVKQAAVAEALARWPSLGQLLRLKKNWGAADAALIAEHARVTRLGLAPKDSAGTSPAPDDNNEGDQDG